jgi:glucoamylase
MPRDLPIGNGRLLVNFDRNYQLRDIYFPNIGKENQTNGHPCRLGVWIEGQFRWIDDASWQRTLHYLPDTMVTDVRLVNPALQVQITFHDAVDFHENALIRRLEVENLADHTREVRLFLHHDFHISGNAVGDTAYYRPSENDLDST